MDAILGAHPYLLKVDGLPLVSVRVCRKEISGHILDIQIYLKLTNFQQ